MMIHLNNLLPVYIINEMVNFKYDSDDEPDSG